MAIARVNFQCFAETFTPKDLHILLFYIREERLILAELGQYVGGFEKATPNHHVGLHLPSQIYLCTFPNSAHELICLLGYRWIRSRLFNLSVRDGP